MGEKRNTFLPSDVTRAIKAVEKSGKSLASVEFPPGGGFKLLIVGPETPAVARSGGNEWDEVLSH
jgi:hypothetical protein